MSQPPPLRPVGDRPLRVLVAPDKFKGSLTAAQAAAAISLGVQDAVPDAEVVVIPVSDGGEGTIEALAHAGAEIRTLQVRGPLGDQVAAQWAAIAGTAVIESAQAAGLALVGRPSPESAWAASSYGVGQLMREALDHGYRRIVLGLGGTATTDGGHGMMAALGLLERPDPRLLEAEVVLACDVAVPLTGPRGAAQLFAHQKGADAPTVSRLEDRLVTWASKLRDTFGTDIAEVAGAGAGGGIGAPLLALGRASSQSGTSIIGELTGLRTAIGQAHLVIVAEGSLDRQSLEGKAPIAIARMAQEKSVRCIAVAGRVTAGEDDLRLAGVLMAHSLSQAAASPEDAMANAAAYLRKVTAQGVGAALKPHQPHSDSGPDADEGATHHRLAERGR